MYIYIEQQENGSWLFSGYLKRVYYGYPLAQCKRLYRAEAKATGWNGRLVFVQ